jgi:hypothetical protein
MQTCSYLLRQCAKLNITHFVTRLQRVPTGFLVESLPVTRQLLIVFANAVDNYTLELLLTENVTLPSPVRFVGCQPWQQFHIWPKSVKLSVKLTVRKCTTNVCTCSLTIHPYILLACSYMSGPAFLRPHRTYRLRPTQWSSSVQAWRVACLLSIVQPPVHWRTVNPESSCATKYTPQTDGNAQHKHGAIFPHSLLPPSLE